MNRAALFGVVLPIVVLVGWVGRLNWSQRTGTEVHLAVSGFDPRDLLAGHYLTYTVDYGPMQVCPTDNYEDEETCVCLQPASDAKTHVANWVGACSELPASCSTFIRGSCKYSRFEANIERFYFPETFETELAVVPQRSAVTVVVGPSGDGLVKGFTVDGVDLLEYAKTRAEAR